jgi:acyl-CoA synthetase (AMP-forming)/AMP-acid ligase II
MSGPFGSRQLNVADGIRTFARATPDKVAIVDGPRSVTFAELDERSSRLANFLLGQGIAVGGRLGVATGNRYEFMEMVAAAGKAGLVLVPIDPRSAPAEAQQILTRAAVSGVVFESRLSDYVTGLAIPVLVELDGAGLGLDYEQALAAASPVDPNITVDENTPFVISFTGGTTGKPKGVEISHRSRCLIFLHVGVEFGLDPSASTIGVTPMCHGSGLTYAYASLYLGGSLSVMKQWDPVELLRQVEAAQANTVFLVPSHINALRALTEEQRSAYALTSLTTIYVNAAPLATDLKHWLLEWLPGVRLYELYGSTEGGIVSVLRPEDQLRKDRCVGPAWFMTDVRLVDSEGNEVGVGEPGELFSRSPYLFNGYLDDPQATAAATTADGYFSAMDVAVRDADGYLYIVDRLKDMILTGGLNVYSREVEDVLMGHPDITDAAVIGLPDEQWGERVTALVVTSEELDPSSIVAYCRERLAGYKIPKTIEFIATLPHNANGKVQKNLLRQQFTERASSTTPQQTDGATQ